MIETPESLLDRMRGGSKLGIPKAATDEIEIDRAGREPTKRCKQARHPCIIGIRAAAPFGEPMSGAGKHQARLIDGPGRREVPVHEAGSAGIEKAGRAFEDGGLMNEARKARQTGSGAGPRRLAKYQENGARVLANPSPRVGGRASGQRDQRINAGGEPGQTGNGFAQSRGIHLRSLLRSRVGKTRGKGQ
jgi:hypothetical protein